jgi:hypothetical protein
LNLGTSKSKACLIFFHTVLATVWLKRLFPEMDVASAENGLVILRDTVWRSLAANYGPPSHINIAI